MNSQPDWRALLEEQKAYYHARAAEYDAWFYRVGRFDHGPALNAHWSREAREAHEALLRLGPVEHALELACGTGIWTDDLTRIAGRVTALDSSSDMLALNEAKLDSPQVTYKQVDLFHWEPAEQVDLVVIACFLSHVPAERLTPFLAQVRRAVKPGGRLFVVDTQPEQTAAARDMAPIERGTPVQLRRLNDGREYHVIKVYYERVQLEQALRDAGFEPHVEQTAQYFIYAVAQG